MTKKEWDIAFKTMDSVWDTVSKDKYVSIAHKVFHFADECRFRGYSGPVIIPWNESRKKFLITEGLNPNGRLK